MLKQERRLIKEPLTEQPPSGGCVLKLYRRIKSVSVIDAATFGWLCVEPDSVLRGESFSLEQPLSGGCVLKLRKSTS